MQGSIPCAVGRGRGSTDAHFYSGILWKYPPLILRYPKEPLDNRQQRHTSTYINVHLVPLICQGHRVKNKFSPQNAYGSKNVKNSSIAVGGEKSKRVHGKYAWLSEFLSPSSRCAYGCVATITTDCTHSWLQCCSKLLSISG